MSHSLIDYPPRVSLARTPTPLKPSRRVGHNLGIDLYFKRDDLTGGASSGNKIRKLEFSIFIHTGGLLGLFPLVDEIAQIL
jgi:1-aminocyclopropane-1-carboxylate deaminase/D-cysteine desulfhydrase-like pyridoxal-dependent ACC family enzyme